MFVTKGKILIEINKQELDDFVSAYDALFLDIGAGSGKFIYRLAKQSPKVLCIGLETSHDSLLEHARKIEKKRERGGLPNVLYILGSIEAPPSELCGIADEVFVNYPWTNLIKALVTGERSILEKLHSLFRAEGILNLTLSYDRRYEKKFVEDYGLPELSQDYIANIMTGLYRKSGFEIQSISRIGYDEMKLSKSEWGKRLAFSRERIAWRIRFVRISSTHL